MKTFEERYTAWIDNKLEGPALTSFELELSRRASAGEARADKEEAARLHRLLTTYLTAPTMGNAEFFSHQLRERIDAERATGRRREEARQARGSFFAWPFVRLAGLGAAAVFVATALYYGMMPPHAVAPAPRVAQNPPVVQPVPQASATATVPEVLAPRSPGRSPGGSELALASPTPVFDLNANFQVIKVPSTPNTSATPLQYKDANVLWINGLDYMPTVPGESPTNGAPAPATNVKP